MAARVTAGITDAGDGWYSADVTIPATTASVRWDSTGTTDAKAREYFVHEQVWGKTMTEPSAAPAVTASVLAALQWVFVLSRNKITQTATTQTLRNDADSGTISTSTVSRRWDHLHEERVHLRMAAPVVKNFTQAVIGTSVSSPSDTAIGDLVICFVWSQGTDSTTLTHAIQSTFTTIRSHAHEDGTTDGRLSVACKIATAIGTQTYTPYTITNATANQTAIACITVTGADTTDPASWIQGSSTNTGNQAPDPPSLAGLNRAMRWSWRLLLGT